MKKYIPTFGIEIHAELSTKTKAFSSARVDFNAKPNTAVNPVDLGYPGAKPTVNKKMVEYSYRLAKILNMKIEDKLYFDRKSYFYPDLPKGFQITQFFKPIGTNGKFTIFSEGVEKEISITEIHMEEDTAKQIKIAEGILFDFNRSGVPLIEIVSGHEELMSIEDVIAYVKQMRSQLVILGINDGKMEEGSFRVDVNVSLRPEGQKEYGVRTEIKNLNSFSNIKKALEVEMERHKLLYEEGKVVECMTVRYDEDTEKTVPMRLKDSGLDYNFIPEGNITPIVLTGALKEEFNNISKSDIVVSDFYSEWNDKMSQIELSIILSTNQLFKLFLSLKTKIDYREAVNFIVNDIKSVMNSSDNKIFRMNEEEIIGIIKLRKEGKINSKESNKLINLMFNSSIEKDIKELENKVLLSEDEIILMINEMMTIHNEVIQKDINDRPEKVERFLMGQLMKETKGKASPQLANELVKKVLWEK